MLFRVRFLIFILALAILALASPVSAGGWAVITLDELSGEAEVGKPFEVGFTVLQHGIAPMEGLAPEISARNPDTNETFSTTAISEGEAGHYVAVLDFPSQGSWDWSIEAFTMNQPMPQISVRPSPLIGARGGIELSRIPLLPWLVGAAGFLIAAGGLIFLLRRGVRWAAAFIVIGTLAIGYGFASAASQGADPVVDDSSRAPSQESAGQDLFLAKGCVTCHAHAAFDQEAMSFGGIGPDLTDFTAAPDYLRLWLSDPASVKPNTKMPNLHLNQAEIEDLIVFINEK
jgi:cytochrome c2